MKTEKSTLAELEVWAIVDCNGEYVVSETEDEVSERYKSEVSEDPTAQDCKRIRLTIRVPLPKCTSVTVDIPSAPAEDEITVKVSDDIPY